jgi:hypothetical protein
MRDAATLLACVMLATLVLASSALAAALWLRDRDWSGVALAIGSFAALGLLAYAAAAAFFFTPVLGWMLALGVPLAAGVYAWRRRREVAPSADTTQCAFLVGGVCLVYLALLFLPRLGCPVGVQSAVRFGLDLPLDPLLPQTFGERLFAGAALKPFEGDWLSSDRPPLQAGFYLLVRPWLALLRLPPDVGYQCTGTLVQLFWVPAAWMLARRLGATAARAALVGAILAVTGFFFVNSLFVWPKLLAAAYVIFAALLLLDPTPPAGARGPVLAALCAALAWLAHGGAAFSLLALAPLWWWLDPPRRRHVWRATAAFVVLATPWLLYQHFVDPPGNRLLKWHLAGVADVDGRSFTQALADAYRSMTWPAWGARKAAQVRTLFAGSWDGVVDVFFTPGRERRANDFYYLVRSLGVLNLAWPAALLLRFGRRQPAPPPAGDWMRRLLAWTLFTLAGWVLLMFEPHATVIHQGSYAVTITLGVVAVLLLLALPAWAAAGVLGWHAFYFAATWLPYFGRAPLDWAAFGSLALGVVLLALAWRRVRRKPPAD